jgi:hypothetical protein
VRRAAERFDVFVTVDANLRYQQNALLLGVAVIVLRAVSNDMSDLLPLARNISVIGNVGSRRNRRNRRLTPH